MILFERTVETGFRKVVLCHEEFLSFPPLLTLKPSRINLLKVSNHTLVEMLARENQLLQGEMMRKEACEQDKERRMKSILLHIQEDSRLRKEKADRAKKHYHVDDYSQYESEREV